ncbi:MAG TPA: pyridoxamine 5'-phosphate oxidase family protein [Candidatus Eisenbacteria bacterium]|nr:pyridoxamine 5'-phosphate oxidase family protein [Candidatus Eisenbacteria bacterium]
MIIRQMGDQECRVTLARTSLARLGCCLENQPYVVPVYIAYEPGFIYVFSTLGQKIEWMRANPRVCIQADEIVSESNWASVVVNGRFQDLPEPKFSAERAHARQLLKHHHDWWLNAVGERRLTLEKDLSMEPVFFRIEIESTTGLRAIPEGQQTATLSPNA